MPILMQLTIAVVSAAVLFGVIWTVYGSLRTPVRPGRGTQVHTVVTATGRAEGLEQSLRGLIWLTENGFVVTRILLVDRGMDEEGLTLARLLTKKYANIVICQAEEVQQWIEETT